jgi:hypothetical protein
MDLETIVLQLLDGPAGVITFTVVEFAKLECLLQLLHIGVMKGIPVASKVINLDYHMA